MMSTQFYKFLFSTTASLLLFAHIVTASPVTQTPNFKDDIAKESFEEVNDLNVASSTAVTNRDVEEIQDSLEESSFVHHDEDLPRMQTSLESEDSLKYDVEILESRDSKKENIEVEEQFKGSAIRMNTDTFIDENIEVNGGDDEGIAKLQSHTALTIILVIVALVSIGLYAALVIWRSHLEQRYGMRELLVTNENDDDFGRSSNNINSRSCSSAVDTRHFTLGQA